MTRRNYLSLVVPHLCEFTFLVFLAIDIVRKANLPIFQCNPGALSNQIPKKNQIPEKKTFQKFTYCSLKKK